MTDFDSIHSRRTRPRSQPRRPIDRPQRSGSGRVLTVVAMVAAVFFILTRPPTSADPASLDTTTPAASQPAAPTVAQSTPFGLPEPTTSVPLEQTVILDRPLPSSSDQTVTTEQPASSSEVPTKQMSAPAPYTVRILNGNGIVGDAAAARRTIEAAGIQVTTIGTASHRYAKTTIYYQSGQREAANHVREVLTVPQAALIEDRIAAPADVLVVLGTDHR